MNEVPHSSSIKSLIIRPKHCNWTPFLYYNLLDYCKQITSNIVDRIISNESTVVITSWIEISQRYDLPIRISIGHRSQQPVHAQLSLTIRTNWIACKLLSAVILLAVDSCRWRKYELFALFVFCHQFNEVDRPYNIILVIIHGLLNWFWGWFFGCEMNDGSNWFIFLILWSKNMFQHANIQNIP